MKEILLILVLQLIHVPIFTLRTIFVVKNMSSIAASLGFMEAIVYIFGLSLVLSGDQTVIAMLVYAVGFGAGIFMGTRIEQKLAIGYINIAANLQERDGLLIECLRDQGFGVTVYEGEGRDSKRYKLDILAKRSREQELLGIIEKHQPKAFIMSYEPRKFKGGFLVKAMKKRVDKQNKK